MFQLMRKCGLGLGFLGLLSIVVAALQFVVPLYMMTVYNRILQTRSVETLMLVSLIAAALLAILGVTEMARSRVMAMMATRIGNYLNRDVYEAVLASPASALGKAIRQDEGSKGSGTAGMARSQAISDLRQVSNFVASGAMNTFYDAVMAPAFLAALFLLHPLLGWIGLGASLVILSLAILSEILARSSNQRIGAAEGRAQDKIERSISQFDAVAAMGIAPHLYDRWNRDRQNALAEGLTSQSLVGAIGSLAKALRLIAQMGVLGTGAWLVLTQEGFLSGALIAASIILGRALAPIDQSIAIWRRFVQARSGARRLVKIVEAVEAQPERTPTPPPDPELSLDRVTLAFPGQRIAMLQDATLSVKGGQTMGILGPVGSGKTTLMRAMAGLHVPRSGTIRLGATPVDGFTNENRMRDFGYLPQDIQLLPGTIADNISRFTAQSADVDDLFAAAQAVGATGFIESLPEGFATEFRAEHFSAGQTQLIGLARAIYNDPLVLLLDEPTANLDAVGKDKVKALIDQRNAAGKITLLVSHDQEMLRSADMLLYLAPGVAKYGKTAEIFRFVAHLQEQAARTITANAEPRT